MLLVFLTLLTLPSLSLFLPLPLPLLLPHLRRSLITQPILSVFLPSCSMIAGLGTSPSASVRLDFGKIDAGVLGPGGRPAAAPDQRDLPARRRRYVVRVFMPFYATWCQ